jgi:hypothetical protein
LLENYERSLRSYTYLAWLLDHWAVNNT